jgi:hypothetical protein
MKSLEKLIKSMPTEINIYDKVVAPPAFVRENDWGRKQVMLSAEESESYLFADYYGEFRGGYPWIHPALEAWAKDRGFYWEWVNPGVVALQKA